MKWLLLLSLLAVSYYTYTYGRWALKNGYRRGGIGIMLLVVFVISLGLYGLFLKMEF